MRPESRVGTPAEWLRRAKSNLIRAKQARPEGVCWEDLCFDAQQAVEKALKGVLISFGVPFRFVHDIAELLTRLEDGGIYLPTDVRLAAALSDYAVDARYPGLEEPVTEEEYQQAIALAEVVVHWAEQLIQTDEDERQGEKEGASL